MKKPQLPARFVFVCGYTAAIAAQIAGLISFNTLGFPALVGGLICSGLIGLALSDYARKPRFRVRRPDQAAVRAEVPTSLAARVPACDWTYTTRSA